MSDQARILFRYLSQEDLLKAGCLDFNRAIDAAEKALLGFGAGYPKAIRAVPLRARTTPPTWARLRRSCNTTLASKTVAAG